MLSNVKVIRRDRHEEAIIEAGCDGGKVPSGFRLNGIGVEMTNAMIETIGSIHPLAHSVMFLSFISAVLKMGR